MVKYRFKRTSKEEEPTNKRNPYLVDDDYYQDVVDTISETDYTESAYSYSDVPDEYGAYYDEPKDNRFQDNQNEYPQRPGMIARARNAYQNKVNDIKDYYNDQVEYQKSYYEDSNARWIQKQQVKRDSEFMQKLIISFTVLAIISFIIFLLTRL